MSDVTISYLTGNGTFTAVDEVSFSVGRGEKFVLLAPRVLDVFPETGA